MERSAASDDLVTCPICGERDALFIRWIPEIDHRVHTQTDVGCDRCQVLRSAKEDRWAFADWNHWACEEWAKKGQWHPHATLYALLVEEGQSERSQMAAAARVSQYLQHEVAGRCEWKPGDRFESLDWPGGHWSVRSVQAVYGTNTGPFSIIDAIEILSSGILGEDRREFWDHQANLRRLSPYIRPRKWAQVRAGDRCLLDGVSGSVLSVDATKHLAAIKLDAGNEEIQTARLSNLQVPVHRLERDDA